MRDLLARKMLHYMSGTILIYVLGFVFVPAIITKLGLVEFGLYSSLAIFSVGGYVSLLEMGLQTAATKYAAEYYEQKKFDELKALFSSIASIYIFLGLITAFGGYYLTDFIMDKMGVPTEYWQDFSICLKITFFSFIVSFPSLAYISILKGLQKFVVSKNIELVIAVFKAAGVLVLLAMGYKLIGIVIFLAFLQILQLLIYALYVHREFVFLRFEAAVISVSEIRKLMSMSRVVFMGQLSSVAFQHTDRILISFILGPKALGLYEAIIKIPSALKSFGGQMNSLLMPISSSLESRNNAHKILQTLFKKALRYQLVLTVPLLFWIGVFSKELLKIWVGDDFVAYQSLLILALFWNLLLPYFNVGASILLGHNKKTKELIKLSVISAILNIVFNIVLIKHFELMGIVAATILSLVIVLPLNLKIYQDEIKFNIFDLVNDFFKVLAAGILCSGIYYFLKNQFVWEIENYLDLILSLLIWCGFYFGILIAFVFDYEDRKLIVNLVKKPV